MVKANHLTCFTIFDSTRQIDFDWLIKIGNHITPIFVQFAECSQAENTDTNLH